MKRSLPIVCFCCSPSLRARCSPVAVATTMTTTRVRRPHGGGDAGVRGGLHDGDAWPTPGRSGSAPSSTSRASATSTSRPTSPRASTSRSARSSPASSASARTTSSASRPCRPTERASSRTDRVDLVIATYTINDERKEQVDFAGPYYVAGQDLLVRQDDDSINGPDDLAGKKVCAATGSTPIERIRTDYPRGRCRSSSTPTPSASTSSRPTRSTR